MDKKRIRILIVVCVMLMGTTFFMIQCDRFGADSAEHDPSAEVSHETSENVESYTLNNHEEELVDEEHEALWFDEHYMTEYGIELNIAGPGEIERDVSFPGEIVLNSDRTVQVVTQVGGIVREVRKTLGERVSEGDVLAVIESRILAELIAGYQSSWERKDQAQIMYDREQGLRDKNVSSEQEMLDARAALTESHIQFRAARQKLLALGLTEKDMQELALRENTTLYDITALQGGAIIDRRITVGDVLAEDSPVFLISDLDVVWADFNVSQNDLDLLAEGQRVIVSDGRGREKISGQIVHVSMVLDPETRTALVRVTLPNRDGRWRPGLFVTGTAEISRTSVPVAVPLETVQMLEGKPIVFIRENDTFEPREVVVGDKDRVHAEIISGLEPGEQYVSRGAFYLKASMVTNALGSHAGHGH